MQSSSLNLCTLFSSVSMTFTQSVPASVSSTTTTSTTRPVSSHYIPFPSPFTTTPLLSQQLPSPQHHRSQERASYTKSQAAAKGANLLQMRRMLSIHLDGIGLIQNRHKTHIETLRAGRRHGVRRVQIDALQAGDLADHALRRLRPRG